MPLPPYSDWLRHRQVKPPEADRLIPIIANAPQGISRGEIGAAIKLDRKVLDEFLDGLVRVGVVRVAIENGIRVYRIAAAGRT